MVRERTVTARGRGFAAWVDRAGYVFGLFAEEGAAKPSILSLLELNQLRENPRALPRLHPTTISSLCVRNGTKDCKTKNDDEKQGEQLTHFKNSFLAVRYMGELPYCIEIWQPAGVMPKEAAEV